MAVGRNTTVAELAAATPRYSAEGYDFVARAVTYATEKPARRRHVSARELLESARELAEREYGAVYPLVLENWGISTAHDVGFLVYRMIEAGILCASAEDSPSDFEIDFNFFPAARQTPPELPKII